MTDRRSTERRKTCSLQKYHASSRDRLFGLHENSCLADIHCACAKTLLAPLTVDTAKDDLAVPGNTRIASAAFAFGRLRGIRVCGCGGLAGWVRWAHTLQLPSYSVTETCPLKMMEDAGFHALPKRVA